MFLLTGHLTGATTEYASRLREIFSRLLICNNCAAGSSFEKLVSRLFSRGHTQETPHLQELCNRLLR